MGKQLIQSFSTRVYHWANVPEKLYLIVALIGVIGFALITPPFQGPDEQSHYIRAQYISHGYILPVDANKANTHLPLTVQSSISSTLLKDPGNGGLKKYNIRESLHEAKTPLNAEGTYQPPMISYTAVPYLPAIPAIAIANTLNLNPIISMYAARISLALFCVLLAYFAIKIVPQKKYLFTAIALTPMLLFQQSVVSTDGTSYALLLFFICFVLYLGKKPIITTKQWAWVGVLCVAITLAKPLVFLFLPLVLLLFKKRLAKIWIPAITIFCVLLFAATTLYNSHLTDGVVDPNVPKDANYSKQLVVIKEKPARFLRVMWNTYTSTYGDNQTRGIIGVFGAADTFYPLSMTFIYVIVLTYVAAVRFKREDEERLPKSVQFLLIGCGALYFSLVNLAMYLSFTPVDFNIIYGVQGRYFLPLLIMAPLFAIPFLTIIKKYQQKVLVCVGAGLLALTIVALFITFQRYYLYTP